MPYKLVPPQADSTPYWYVRGTEFGVYRNSSTKTRHEREARKFLKAWKDEAQRLAVSKPKREVVTFASAALSYMQSGRSKLFLAPLIKHFGEMPIDEIGQQEIDRAAAILYPDRAPQTINRQVYTPVSAILKYAGSTLVIKRPQGAQGGRRVHWLQPEEAFRLLDAADAVDERIGALMSFLLYCGPRLSEALRLEWQDVDLPRQAAYIRITKNGFPVTLYLPEIVVAKLANLPKKSARVFRLTKCSRLYAMLQRVETMAGIELPSRTAFHILRHTWATWMRRYGGLDTAGLVGTGLWKSKVAASIYEHVDPLEEARKADRLPTASRSEFAKK